MWIAVGWIAVGLALLLVGADLLVRGATSLALRMGITPLVVGLTVVAFGTSSPELVVSVKASLAGQGPITLGTVIGSNIANIALILGLASLIRPIEIHLQVLRVDLPIMIVVSFVVAGIMLTGELSRAAGAVLVAGVIAYSVVTIRMARNEARSKAEETLEESVPAEIHSVPVIALLCIAGPALLALGADWSLKGAIQLAEAWGVSEAVIGLTIIAVGGSLPELATSVVAAAQGKGDIAIGNVVGSNIFNLLCVLGAAAAARAIPIAGIGGVDVAMMLFVSVLIFPLMWTGGRLRRWEGALMLVLYGGYVVSLFLR
jgi:cation:H+ antiporter